jgi:hypothetical protein
MKENPLSTIYLLLPSWPLGTGNINRSVFIYGGWLGVEGAMVNVAGRLGLGWVFFRESEILW